MLPNQIETFEDDKDLVLLLEELLRKYYSFGSLEDRSKMSVSFEVYQRALPLLEFLNHDVSHFFTVSIKSLLDIIYYYNHKNLFETEGMIPLTRYLIEEGRTTFFWDLGTPDSLSKKEIEEYISVMSQPEEWFRHTESLQVLQKLYPYVDFSKPFKLVVKKSTDPTLKIDSYTTSVVNFPGENKYG